MQGIIIEAWRLRWLEAWFRTGSRTF